MADNIKDGPLRNLTHVIGHDAEGRGGRFPLPSRLRGTVDICRYAGEVVQGMGLNAEQRGTNGRLLQAAADFAHENGKFVDIPSGRYEGLFTGMEGDQKVGLQFKAGIRGVYGAPDAIFAQYARNFPIVTLGQVRNRLFKGEYNNINVVNAVAQKDQVDSCGIQLGALTHCRLDQISVEPFNHAKGAETGYFDPYDGIKSITPTFWSNQIGRMNIGAAQRNFLRMTADGTGSNWEVLYVGGHRHLNRIPISEAAILLQNTNQNHFDQVNIEWITGTALKLANAKLQEINSLHIEGTILPDGWMPTFIHLVGSELIFNAMQFFDPTIVKDGYSGDASLFQTYGRCLVTGRGLMVRIRGNGKNDTDFFLYSHRPDDASNIDSGSHASVFNVQSILMDGDHRMLLDPTIAGDTYGGLPNSALRSLGGYNWNCGFSRTEGLSLSIPTEGGSYVLYGLHRNAHITANEPLAGDVTLVLSDRLMPGDGIGSACQREKGDIITVHRTSRAGGDHELRLMQPDGKTLIENIAANQNKPGELRKLVFNGATWNSYS